MDFKEETFFWSNSNFLTLSNFFAEKFRSSAETGSHLRGRLKVGGVSWQVAGGRRQKQVEEEDY